jgi:hypothetical protein
LPHLIGGKAAFWQTRVADPDLDFNDSVAPHARTHSERQASEGELKMGDFRPLCRQSNLPVGGKSGRLKLAADREPGAGGGRIKTEASILNMGPLFDERVRTPS